MLLAPRRPARPKRCQVAATEPGYPTQITASSQQQLIGVDQVAVAMQSILQASKQNATGTQQAEAGARNLNELGQKLKKLTQRFTV